MTEPSVPTIMVRTSDMRRRRRPETGQRYDDLEGIGKDVLGHHQDEDAEIAPAVDRPPPSRT